MSTFMAELPRIVAYGGFGFLLGFVACLLAADRHQITAEVLGEAARDMPSKRRRIMSTENLQSLIVIVLMLMMLVTGVLWLRSDQENAEQDQRECMRSAETARVLRDRTRNYLEAAKAERALWLDVRRVFIKSGASDSPLLSSIDDYLAESAKTIAHLRDNPYPKASPGSC